MYFLSSKEISRAVSPNHHRHHHHHHFRWNRWRTTPNPYRSTWDPWRTTESPWWEYNENSTRPTIESWEEATEYPWEVNATTEGWWTARLRTKRGKYMTHSPPANCTTANLRSLNRIEKLASTSFSKLYTRNHTITY
jgi:hypothetical protein